jgi:flagellar motor switch protein FliG
LTKQLSEKEFEKTFGNKMTDVTEIVTPVVDIWNYVKELVKQNLVDKYVYENNIVEKVYRNDSSTFDHILLPTADENVFVTLVIDVANKTMLGHIKLDLNKKYGLT